MVGAACSRTVYRLVRLQAVPTMKVSKKMPNSKRKRFTVAEAKDVGERLGIQWDQFDVNQFRDGMNAELAAGTYNPVTHFASDDPILVGKVVRTHLNKTPDYYMQWAAGEKAAEREYSRKPTMQPQHAKTG